MKYFIMLLKVVVGAFLLLAWGFLTIFITGAAFGSYFDHSSIGYALFLGPLLTAGRHLLQSLRASYRPTKTLVVTDYGTDMLLTAAVSSFLTHYLLGPYVSSPYSGIGALLVLAVIGIQVGVRYRHRQKKTDE